MPVYRGRTPGTWRVVIWVDGCPREQIVRGTKARAREHEAAMRLRAPSAASMRAGLTVAQLVSGPYAAHAETHLGAETWRTRRAQLAAVTAKLGDVRIAALTDAHVEAYQAARSREVKASTCNNELRVLGTALRWARRLGYRVSVPHVRRLRERTPRVMAWTVEELQRLYAAARIEAPHLIPMLVTLANTGMRRGEAMRSEWSWVDWEAAMLRIPVLPDWQPKNGKPRDIPLSPAVVAVLTPRGTAGPLLPRLDGEHYQQWPKELWGRIRDRAGLRGGAHQLRHTFASHFLESTADLYLLAKVLGHSHTRTTELYAHLLPSHLERARGAVNLAPALETMADTMAKPPGRARKHAKA